MVSCNQYAPVTKILPDIKVLRNILNLEILAESPKESFQDKQLLAKKEIRKLCDSWELGTIIFWAAGNYLDHVMLNV